MMSAADATGEEQLRAYVIRNFDFMFECLPYFQEHWEVMQVKRASYYRIFRMNMLDDCGAIGAALVDAYRLKRDGRYLSMIRKIANYITNVQLRLEDGTLSRPDPRYMTLWADDLYMSVPFLARMGALTGETRYYDDAAHQVTSFVSRLTDPETGLLKHAWLVMKTVSVASWGRATVGPSCTSGAPALYPVKPSDADSWRSCSAGTSWHSAVIRMPPGCGIKCWTI
jgi:rhamnogalacturonyl hydrolase YesR